MLQCPLLSVPTKKPSEADFNKPLKRFVNDTYGAELEKEISSSIEDFNKLRGSLCSKYNERSDAVLELYYRYFDQLNALEAKAVVCVGGPISVHFKWQRAFDRDSSRKNISMQSSAFEKICILFNIAALQSQLAEAQNRASDDGLKQCARYLQQASGTFQFLRDQLASPFVTSQLGTSELHTDLHGDLVGALAALMIAQAQDCMFNKARNDKMKDAVLVKLAVQCREMYADFTKAAGPFRDMLPRDWFPLIESKRTVLNSLAEFYASRGHIEAQEHGKAISRLTTAHTALAALAKSEGKQFAFNDELNSIKLLLESSQKDNNLIYHDKVIDYRSLPALERAQIAKPIAPKQPFSTNFRDLFDKLVPMRIHSAVKTFEGRFVEAVQNELRGIREATALMNSVLTSLNLPAALEEVINSAAEQGSKVQRSSEIDLPDSVRENAQKVRDAGGFDAIRSTIRNIPEILQQNRDMLDEISRAIEEEETSDRKLREQFGTKWTRTPSDKLNASFRAELVKYKTLIDTAANADAIVRERYDKLASVIELLSKSDDAIREAMPKRSESTLSGNQLASLAASGSVAKLKALCDRARSIKTSREDIEGELSVLASVKDGSAGNGKANEVFDNIRSVFLSALQSDGATIAGEDDLTNTRITETLGPYRDMIRSSLEEQAEVLGALEGANNAFLEERAKVTGQKLSEQGAAQDVVNKRAAFLQSLHSGYDGYVELRTNVEEGNKFYADLLQILMKFQQRVQDYCFGRKIEKDEALADLNANAAQGARAQAPPEAPAYQKSAPPVRPPPPVPTAPTPSSSSASVPASASAPPPPSQPTTAAACPPFSTGLPTNLPPAAPVPVPASTQQQAPYPLTYPAPVPPAYATAYPGAPAYAPYPSYPGYPPPSYPPYPMPAPPSYPYPQYGAPYGYPPPPQPPAGYPGAYPPPNPPR